MQELQSKNNKTSTVITDKQNEYLETMKLNTQLDFSEEFRRLFLTFKSMLNAIIVADINANIVLMNHKAEILTGWMEEEAIKRSLRDVLPIFDWCFQSSFEDDIDNIINKGKTLELPDHVIFVDKNKKNRVVTGYISPIFDENDNVIGIVLDLDDTTEKQKMEKEMQKIQRFESLGILAGGIAHDFNNILTAILGNISMAKIGSNPKEIMERLTETEKALDRAKYLTQQLLNFSKNDLPVKESSSIDELLVNSVNFMLSGSNVRCVFDIPDDLWIVDIDENQINQVITNITINAIQAMAAGGVLKVYARNVHLENNELPTLERGNYVRISIEDHGIGISNDILNKIFDPYFTTKNNGSGLGLAVSLSIIKNHNGHITVSSQVGIGTTFHIYLPISSKEQLIKKKESVSNFVHEKGKILVLDDDELIRELTHTILSSFGYEVFTVSDGTEAIDSYKKAKELGKPFDAVIMDLTIPGGMGAKETIGVLSSFDPNVRAIISSGYSSNSIVTDFAEHGFKGAIVKPYGVKELSSILNSIIMDSD